MDEITTEAFFEKLKKRNKEAFRILYETFKVPLYSLVFSIIKDNDRTADIIQDTFIKVIKSIGTLEDIRKIKYWIFRIAINITMNIIKRDKRLKFAGDGLEDIMNRSMGSHFVSRGDEDRDEMYYAIQQQALQLPLKQRIVFTLKYMDDFKESEIAETLGIPVGTVKSRLSTARAKIKENISL